MDIRDIEDVQRILVAAHRGDRARHPENTMPAFEAAIALGVDMIETDLRRTADGHIVLLHDATVDRTTDGSGAAGEMTLAQIRAFDADKEGGSGLRVPTFIEFLDLVEPHKDLLLNIEFKEYDPVLCDEAIRLLRQRGMADRCVFACFDAAITGYLHTAYGVCTQGFPKEKMRRFAENSDASYKSLWAVGISMELLTPERVLEFTQMHIQPWCYPPNDAQSVRFAADCGARLMTCDDVRPALEFLKKESNR